MDKNKELIKALGVIGFTLVLLFGVLPVLTWLLLDVAPPSMGLPLWAIYVWYLLIACFLALGKAVVYLTKEVG